MKNNNKQGLCNIALLFVISIFMFSSCDLLFNDTDEEEEPTKAWTEYELFTFRAQKATDNTFYDAPARLIAEGTHCLVYVEDANPKSVSLINNIAKEFDNNIYSKIVDTFGEHADVDGSGKVTILLLDIVDGYTGGGYVAGYFDPTHLFDTTTYENSNERDMLFVDVNPAVPGSEEFYSTIAHEFQHLINFSQTVILGSGTEQDLWINEGLSSGAEYIYSGQINQNRVDWYNSGGAVFGGDSRTITHGNNFFVWNGYWEEEYDDAVLDNYATVSLFFQWLRIHASNGTDIYGDILASSYRDFRAVTAAAASRIDADLGTWETLLESWFISNILPGTSGYYGYNGELEVAMPYFNSSDNYEWVFSPGEGILSLMPEGGENTPTTGSGTHIKYLGIDYFDRTIDPTTPYTGDFSLVFNANSDNSGDDETGFIANRETVPQSSLIRSIEVSAPRPQSWPVDIQLKAGGGYTEDSHRVFPKKDDGVAASEPVQWDK